MQDATAYTANGDAFFLESDDSDAAQTSPSPQAKTAAHTETAVSSEEVHPVPAAASAIDAMQLQQNNIQGRHQRQKRKHQELKQHSKIHVKRAKNSNPAETSAFVVHQEIAQALIAEQPQSLQQYRVGNRPGVNSKDIVGQFDSRTDTKGKGQSASMQLSSSEVAQPGRASPAAARDHMGIRGMQHPLHEQVFQLLHSDSS